MEVEIAKGTRMVVAAEVAVHRFAEPTDRSDRFACASSQREAASKQQGHTQVRRSRAASEVAEVAHREALMIGDESDAGGYLVVVRAWGRERHTWKSPLTRNPKQAKAWGLSHNRNNRGHGSTIYHDTLALSTSGDPRCDLQRDLRLAGCAEAERQARSRAGR